MAPASNAQLLATSVFMILPANPPRNHSCAVQLWDSYKPGFTPPAGGRLADALVPSADTVRTAWLLQCALASDRPCLFSGESGIGKTVTILDFLRGQRQMAAVVGINFSSRTTSADVQRLVEVCILDLQVPCRPTMTCKLKQACGMMSPERLP